MSNLDEDQFDILIKESPNINPAFAILREIHTLRMGSNLSVMDAAIHYAETTNTDIEYIGELIKNDPKLCAEITEEAEDLNFIQKKNRLEFEDDGNCD